MKVLAFGFTKVTFGLTRLTFGLTKPTFGLTKPTLIKNQLKHISATGDQYQDTTGTGRVCHFAHGVRYAESI